MTNAMSTLSMPSEQYKYQYSKYYKGELSINKCKLPELKDMARCFKIRITGTKPELVDRIELFFKKTKCAIQIQSMFRGHLVRFSIRLRGCALKERTLCVNDTDFYTLDPLNEIEYNDFYSYTDKTKFIYGFSVSSLISLFKRSGYITNPYNREKLDFKTMNEIFLLHKLNNILYPVVAIEKPATVVTEKQLTNQVIPPTTTENAAIDMSGSTQTNQIVSIVSNPIHANNAGSHITAQGVHAIPDVRTLSPDQVIMLERMNDIQSKPLETRIRELFMEIDQLGNYTQEEWFTSLSIRGLVHLFRYLHDIWNYRGQLTSTIKSRICSLRDPFYNMNRDVYMHGITVDTLRNECLSVMEHMVYTGIDIEYQRIGTLHVLSAFTLVSIPARQSMYWLYEGLTY